MFLAAVVSSVVLAQLVPEPISVDMRDRDEFRITSSTRVMVSPDLARHMPIINDAARMDLRQDTISTRDEGIFIGIENRFPPFEERRLRTKLRRVDDPPPGGYRLIVDDDHVIISGADVAGAVKGMHTLAQMIRGNDPLPGVEILDGPAAFRRGVYQEGRPSISLINEAAALKADFFVVDSTDVWDDTGRGNLDPIVTRAQILGLDVVPMFRPLEDAGRTIETHPEAAPTQAQHYDVVLRGEEMVPLPMREMPRTARVTVSGVPMTAREDYDLDQEAPGFSWTIRRIVGGAIPDGATVRISYDTVASGARGLSIASPQAAQLFAEAVGAAVERFGADTVHVGPGDINAIALDERARMSGRGAAELLADFYEPLIEMDSRPRLVIDADAYAMLPREMQRDFTAMGDDARWRMTPLSMSAVYPVVNQLGAQDAIIIDCTTWTDRDRDVIRTALDKAWSPASPWAAWPESLNAYVGADLSVPTTEDARGPLVAYMNKQTLAGNDPADTAREFERHVERARDSREVEDFDLAFANQFMTALAGYLDLEAEYASDPSSWVLRRLVDFVEDYEQVNPDWPQERTQRILEVVENQGLFVPSTILFGEYVYPYRESAQDLVAVAIEPDYAYEEMGARAAINFGVPMNVGRIDFESAGLTSIEWIVDGDNFAQYDSGRIAAPLIAPRAQSATQIEIVARGASERATLRNVRVSVRNPSSVVSQIPRSDRTLQIDGRANESHWAGVATVAGFTRDDGKLSAEQTSVHALRVGDDLYLGVYCHEPRMATMEAADGPRDTVLWPRECVVIELRLRDGETILAAVNPNEVLFDSRDGDPLWNRPWRIASGQTNDSWTAELTIPDAAIGGTIDRIVCTRYRFNARREVSRAEVSVRN